MPTADGGTVNVIFSTTNAKGDVLGNYYSCDLARQSDGSLRLTKVYPTPGRAEIVRSARHGIETDVGLFVLAIENVRAGKHEKSGDN